jgi:hypothetical protein
MRQARVADADDEMRPEYDFTHAVRGKYYQRYRAGCNIVVLDPDLSQVFPDSSAVNQALRLLVNVARRRVRRSTPPQRATRRPNKRMQRTSGAARSRTAARR